MSNKTDKERKKNQDKDRKNRMNRVGEKMWEMWSSKRQWVHVTRQHAPRTPQRDYGSRHAGEQRGKRGASGERESHCIP